MTVNSELFPSFLSFAKEMEKYRRVFQGIPATTTELYGEMSRKVDYKVSWAARLSPDI